MKIGVFDSGAGGRSALAELRRLLNRIDTVFYADEKNAPFGGKAEGELVTLLARGLERLSSAGAEKILIACCTASAVWDYLPQSLKDISVPIIEPTARIAAACSKSGRIGVLSTEATRRSGAFVRSLSRLGCESVVCASAPELVTLAERGARDGALTDGDKEIIYRAASPLMGCGVDTVVLGCTHFAYFEREIADILSCVTVNSARAGAEHIAKDIKNEGRGEVFYLT